ncbi:MAG TPA: hypothetical protein VF384_18550 [Planctomycetota bacterium]
MTTAEAPNKFWFRISDVTGTFSREADSYDPRMSVAAVGADLTRDIAWAKSTPWALRDDSRGEYLDEARPIGEQITPGADLVLTPRTHLG